MTAPESGLGIVIKLEDGNQCALYPAVAEALQQLGMLTPSELKALSSFRRSKIHNWQTTEVGQIRPHLQLHC